MALIALNLESLREVKGGLVELMLEKALTKMAIDIEAAPDIPEWRTVVLEIRAKPICEQMELAAVATEFVVKGKVPARVTSASMLIRSDPNGLRQLVFNLDAQDNVRQHTLLEGSDDDA